MKVVCFDFDGVVIHSSEVQRYAFSESYYQVMGEVAGEEKIQEFFSNSGDSLPNIFRKMGIPLEIVDIYRKVSIEGRSKIKLHQGMKELLSDLKEQNISCALCTGKDRERTIMILKDLKIYRCFDEIVCSDDVENPKPHPQSLKVLMEKFQVAKEEMLMVGDAVNDIKCAKNAGVVSVGVTWGDVPREMLLQAHPDFMADNIEELRSAITYNMRKKLIFNDFVVAEDICNMKCEYCLTQTSHFEKEHEMTCEEKRKLSSYNYCEQPEFQERMDDIQENLLREMDIAVLKISGGEIMMLPKIEEYILLQAKKYRKVQVLTNGVLLKKEQLARFKEAKNICLQISLDHHTMEGNSYRTKDDRILKRILENLELAYEAGLPVEVNCVLTDRNTKVLSGFLDYLLRYEKGVVVYPFPVRGAQKSQYYMREEQIEEIQKIVDEYERYENILAPKTYMEHLLDFLKTGQRKGRCYLPYLAMGVFEDGTVTPCPNYWFNSLGCVLEEPQKVVAKAGTDFIYQVLCGKRNQREECRACFTPWEAVNLYIDGAITYEELAKTPSYSFQGAEEYIADMKQLIMQRG